jgi:hypothetical protein
MFANDEIAPMVADKEQLLKQFRLFEPPPDTRHPECASMIPCMSIDCNTLWGDSEAFSTELLHALPSASIVIPFRNESFTHLQQTIASILAFTPMCLLHEIILVRCSSKSAHLLTVCFH